MPSSGLVLTRLVVVSVAGALPLLDIVALGAAVIAVGKARSGDDWAAALGSSWPNGGGSTMATGSISCSN